jgi:predicted DCC family thiol-disulfide oxidoreductase YuxK
MADVRESEAETSAADRPGVTLVYDGECPVCTAYGCSVDLAPGDGALKRVNAREDAAIVAELTAQGLDLDDGMVVMKDGRYHHGADALHVMAVHGSRRGLGNWLNHVVFRSRTRARLLYPWLRAGRGLLLRLLGRKPIGNLRQRRP